MKKININKKYFSILIISVFTIAMGIFLYSCQDENTSSEPTMVSYEFTKTTPSDIKTISSLIESSKTSKTSLSKKK